jgi:flavin-dependent trigonelline monooxygenase, reductase component
MLVAEQTQVIQLAMERAATGVAVITSRDFLGRPVGTTVNTVSTLSFDPPLVAVALAPTSRTLEALGRHRAFAVNVLSEDQQELAELFAQPGSAGDWPEGDLCAADAPLVEETLAALECELHEIVPGGDHDVVIGAVQRARVDDDGGRPLRAYSRASSRMSWAMRPGVV